jgi:hypothetical protein
MKKLIIGLVLAGVVNQTALALDSCSLRQQKMGPVYSEIQDLQSEVSQRLANRPPTPTHQCAKQDDSACGQKDKPKCWCSENQKTFDSAMKARFDAYDNQTVALQNQITSLQAKHQALKDSYDKCLATDCSNCCNSYACNGSYACEFGCSASGGTVYQGGTSSSACKNTRTIRKAWCSANKGLYCKPC